MDAQLVEMFEQARKLVLDADRRLAEELERQREKEREAALIEFSALVETAFDFTSREKMELEPRLDVQAGKPVMEFVMRSLRAIFFLSPKDDELWALTVAEDGREPQALGDILGGQKSDSASRRLAAARVVTAIGDWSQKLQPFTKKAAPAQSRWQDQAITAPPPEVTERREPTYGTFGKFLGY